VQNAKEKLVVAQGASDSVKAPAPYPADAGPRSSIPCIMFKDGKSSIFLVQDAREELSAAQGASDSLTTAAPHDTPAATTIGGMKPEGAAEVKAEEKEVMFRASTPSTQTLQSPLLEARECALISSYLNMAS
jgi:hypothetical protein